MIVIVLRTLSGTFVCDVVESEMRKQIQMLNHDLSQNNRNFEVNLPKNQSEYVSYR